MLTYNLPTELATQYSVVLPDGSEMTIHNALCLLCQLLEERDGTQQQNGV